MPRGYEDAIEWIEDFFDFDAYEDFDSFIDDVRDEFSNDNLIDAIQDDLIMEFEETRL